MSIDTAQEYKQQFGLPLYLKVTTDEHNHWEYGKKYSMRVKDERFEKRNAQEHPYNNMHECLYLGALTAPKIEDFPPMLVAFAAETRSMSEVEEKWKKYEESDSDIMIGLFLRLDMAENFILNGLEAIPDGDGILEAVEGNG